MFDLIETNITHEDRKLLINDINEYFDTGNWCYFVPKYQTWPNLFSRVENHWKKLQDSFVQHACKKMNTNSFVNFKCWAYKNFPLVSHEGETDWHCHKEENLFTISGVFYLMLPSNDSLTEYMEDNQLKKFPFKENCWTIFNGNMMHRPGKRNEVEMKQGRIVIAADINFRL